MVRPGAFLLALRRNTRVKLYSAELRGIPPVRAAILPLSDVRKHTTFHREIIYLSLLTQRRQVFAEVVLSIEVSGGSTCACYYCSCCRYKIFVSLVHFIVLILP